MLHPQGQQSNAGRGSCGKGYLSGKMDGIHFSGNRGNSKPCDPPVRAAGLLERQNSFKNGGKFDMPSCGAAPADKGHQGNVGQGKDWRYTNKNDCRLISALCFTMRDSSYIEHINAPSQAKAIEQDD